LKFGIYLGFVIWYLEFESRRGGIPAMPRQDIKLKYNPFCWVDGVDQNHLKEAGAYG